MPPAAAPSLKPADLAALLLVVAIWGLNFVVMKVGLAISEYVRLATKNFTGMVTALDPPVIVIRSL